MRGERKRMDGGMKMGRKGRREGGRVGERRLVKSWSEGGGMRGERKEKVVGICTCKYL